MLFTDLLEQFYKNFGITVLNDKTFYLILKFFFMSFRTEFSYQLILLLLLETSKLRLG